MKPHKHAALIKAWADGAEIEFKSPFSEKWITFTKAAPSWMNDVEYRIKPEPKPDVARYAHALHNQISLCDTHSGCNHDNTIKLTFDGETMKLKAVEMIGEKS